MCEAVCANERQTLSLYQMLTIVSQYATPLNKNLAYLNTNARHVSVHIDERGADETTTLYRIF